MNKLYLKIFEKLRYLKHCLIDEKYAFKADEIIRSIPERMYDPEVACHVADIFLIRHATVETYNYKNELPPYWVDI